MTFGCPRPQIGKRINETILNYTKISSLYDLLE